MNNVKFNNYFKSKNLNIRKDLINTYTIYKTNYNKHYLISNGYGIIMTNNIPANYKENDKLKYNIINYFENFIDKNKNELVMSIDIDTIKNNLNSKKIYKINNEYALDFVQLKKIIDIIKGNKINILNNFNHYFIEIVGSNFQVGYLLPMRIY